MQTKLKSSIAFFVAFLLAFTLAPIAAYADNDEQNASPEEYSTEIGPLLDSTSDPQEENSYRYESGERILSSDGARTEQTLSTFSVITNPEGYKVFNWFDKFSKGYYTGTNAFKGIDVSEHNGLIDWKKVKASGVNYAIIRCGYGQNSTSQDDKQWINNVKGCIANGIPFGVYVYSYATNTTKAASEADHVLRCLKDAGLNPSKVGYPVYYDMEDKSTIGSDYAAMATTFCDKIKAAGYIPGVYANKSWFNEKLTASCFNNWTKWVAEWNTTIGLTYSGLSNFTSGNGMWQFSDYGTVPGINSKAVDLDYTFMKPKYNIAFASYNVSGMMRNVTGSALEPKVTVKLDGKTLAKKTDYTISYKNKKTGSTTTNAPTSAGTYEVTVSGAGLYSGTRSLGDMNIYDKPNIDTSMPFRLSSVASSNLVLDAAGGSPKSGANVSVWTINNGSNQMWYLESDGAGCYWIKNAASPNYVLDASNGSPKNGANISVWTKNKGNNQKWVLDGSTGEYVIRNAANNSLVLDASGGVPKSGANVTAWTSSNGKNQKWKLTTMNDLSAANVSAKGMVRNTTGQQLLPTVTVTIGGKQLKEGTDFTVLFGGETTAPIKAGTYTVTVQGKGSYKGTHSVGKMRLVDAPSISTSTKYRLLSAAGGGYLLDAAGGTPKMGANATIWSNNNGDNQKWYFMSDSKGYYTIKNAKVQSYVLDAAGGTPRIGSNVSVWKTNDGLNQKWIIDTADNGSFVLRNAANPELVLDASGGKPKIGANVTAWTYNGGKNQKWQLKAS